MAGEWAEVRVGDLGRIVTGRTPPGNDPLYYGGDVPFLTPSDMAEGYRAPLTARALSAHGAARLNRCLVPKGVGVSCIGWQMGKSALIDRPTITNQQINSIIVDERVADCGFVYYSMLARRDELFNLGAGGSRTPILNKGDFERFLILLPPLAEQRAIAHILGTLDDKIELNRRMNETLAAIARALFKSWFVDFDPVRTKAAGRDPGLPMRFADPFPSRLVDSELGEVPQGWQVRTIGDLAEVFGGSTPRTEEPAYWHEGIHPWATPKDLSSLSTPVLLDTARRITDEGLAQVSSGLLPAGTVFLSSRAPIGYLAIAEIPAAINQGFIAMKPHKGVSNLFLLLWARSAHEDILSHANGSTFLEISKASFRPIPVLTPSQPVFRAFDQLVRPVYRRIVSNERECRALAALRDSLLPRLVSGGLHVTGTPLPRELSA
jgi:type I restriction enzyme, S subunit